MNSGDERYFERIENELETARDLAEEARRRGGDPQPTVEIPTARDMADRVENILGIEGVAERVRELEGKMSREEAALALVEDFVEGAVGSYETPDGKIEGAVRTAVALLTEGVVAAPIEGIDRVEVAENDDGSEYVTVAYAGPIRSAGGTAQALSVLVADYARSLLGIDEFKPRDDEIERYVEEVDLYDSETGLQYSPKDEETRYITKHCPIMLDGEATGDEEVSGFRDLERIDTNSSRGGMCLVLAEGIALKAPKIRRYTDDLDEVEWPWLTDLIEGTIAGDKSGEEATDQEEDEGADETGEEASGPPRIPSNKKYLQDLIAGRPVFGHPSAPGGFRLRYGRSRNLGHATAGVHPATMHVVDDFLAPGTQIKTELPGKAAGIVPVDTIEGPTVRLANGEVTRIDDAERALELRNGVEAIIDLGEYLVNYGEFVENNHDLAPAGYTVEWWRQDMAAAGADVQALADDPAIDLHAPAPEQALAWAAEYDAPLHPTYTHCWHDLEWEDVVALAEAVEAGSIDDGDLVVEGGREIQKTLEVLLVEHTQDGDRARIPTWRPLVRTLGITENLERGWSATELSEDARSWDTAMVAVGEIAPFSVQERAPTRIGNRMGRPEKSEERELQPAVHSLFPIGEAGGNQRDVAAAAKHSDSMRDQPGVIYLEIGVRRCEPCDEETYKSRCPSCGDHLEPYYTCPECNQELEPDEAGRVYCDRCEVTGDATETRPIDVHEAYRAALEGVGEREGSFDILKGVKGLSSTTKTPEPLEKGVLRAKHGVSSFKDGTVRYDMTDLPVTAIKPAEVGVSPEQLRELGYEMDIDGEPLRHDDQVVELKVQDVILSKGGADHLLRTADFVDDLLESYYGMNSYYELEERADLVGELVFGMAPHTSAAVVGRVIGYTSVAGGYAHPYFHAAKRRNCFHPDTKIWIENENGEMAYRRIEDVVEPKLEDPNLDDFGTKFSEVGDLSVPSLSEGGTECLQPVTTVSKHPAPDHMVAIRTRSGRELTVTPDHEMIVHDGDQHRVEAAAVEAGMHLPAPKSIEYEGRNNRIDLVKAFLEQSNLPLDRLVIGNIGPDRIRELFEIGTDEPGFCKPVAEAFDISTSTVYNWINRGAVPASILVELLGRDAVVTELGSQVTLSVKRDHVELQRYLTIDEDVATVLGYYTAEGFVRKEGTCYQTTICTPDDPVREFCLETIKEALGVEAYEENEYKITVSSHLVARLFSDLLELGSDAKSKRIPREIFSSSDAVVSRYLAAYFSGDGSTSSTRLDVRAHTVSEELARDLVAILKRFGISAKRYQEARRVAGGVVGDFYEDDVEFDSWVIKITSENARKYARTVGFDLDRKQDTLENTISEIPCRSQRRLVDGGDTWLDEVIDVTIIESDISHTYCLTVEETHSLVANNLYTGQCDGDEDCVMLLLDGLLNFSKQYLPDKRGGRMDAPLVMSSRIDPAEIDDEAHNVDTMNEYPRGFYEATRELADPGEVEDLMTLAESSVGTESQYEGFVHSQPTTDIAAGPDLSAYKTLESMEHKMDAQLELARKLRAVDETDVAERVIEYHFLPDLIGNLRAFSRQEFLCKGCGEKFRRAPLSGTCRECGDDVNLTVHEGSVNKYLETASEVAEEYGCRGYTKQRLEVLGRSIDRIFENDKNKQSGIADFM